MCNKDHQKSIKRGTDRMNNRNQRSALEKEGLSSSLKLNSKE